LTEGVNMQRKENALEYEGPIWNYIIAYGNASNWASRETYEVWDDESIRTHGLRVKGISVNSNSPATVESAAENYLEAYKNPRRKMDVSATDVEHTFRQLRIGHAPDVETVNMGRGNGSVGFTAAMEIVEMTYQHGAKLMDLVLKEVS